MSDEAPFARKALLPALESESGSMPDLPDAAVQALTWRVVERWSSARALGRVPESGDAAAQLAATRAQELVHGVVRRHARRRLWRAFAVAGVVLGMEAAAFGAVRIWSPALLTNTSREPDRAHAVRGVTPTASPAREPSRAEPEATAPPGVSNTQPPPAANSGTDVDSASLAHANALRAERAWQAAQREYLQIAIRAASARERYVARVAAAALCLQHTGQPQRALTLYMNALRNRPEGELSEEIRLGIAHAQEVLAHPDAEAKALQDFLTHHTDSVQAAAARQRLIELTSEQR